jgi:Family of unknown function (DUF6191)
MTQWGLDTLFNPAKRHMDEEKRRLQSTREEIGDASGGKRIDFDKGKVTIHRPDAEAADPAQPADKPEAPAAKKDKPAPSAAAIRAAQRRGRQPR